VLMSLRRLEEVFEALDFDGSGGAVLWS
jgi:hypothetical protein